MGRRDFGSIRRRNAGVGRRDIAIRADDCTPGRSEPGARPLATWLGCERISTVASGSTRPLGGRRWASTQRSG